MKVLITIVLLSLLLTNCQAQTHSIGANGGILFTGINNPSAVNSTISVADVPRVGALAGVEYNVTFKNTITLSVEVAYNSFGSTTKYQLNTQKYLSIFNYDYLSFPLKIGFCTKDKVFAFGNIGGIFSHLVGYRVSTEIYLNNQLQRTVTGGSMGTITTFDFAATIELGAGYRINEKICIYNFVSFRHSITPTKQSPTAQSGIQHYGFAIVFGFKYIFPNKKDD